MRRSRVLSCAVSVLALLVAGGTAPAAAAPRAAVDLGTLPGDTNSATTAINNNGTITGVSRTADDVGHPVRWSSDGTITQLSLPDGVTSGGTVDVNESDTVIGYWQGQDLWDHAATWDAAGVRIDLPTSAGELYSEAYDINDAGTIVGDDGSGPVRWNTDGTVTHLQLFPGSTGGRAYAINETGTIVGECVLSTGYAHAVRWTPAGAIIDLGTLGGPYSSSVDVNERGVVAGDAMAVVGGFHAVRWSPTNVISDLGTVPRASETLANAMNDRGTVVGYSGSLPVRWIGTLTILPLLAGDSQGNAVDVNKSDITAGFSGTESARRAVVWDAAGIVTELGRLPGAGPAEARAINDHGVVIGSARTADGDTHAVRW